MTTEDEEIQTIGIPLWKTRFPVVDRVGDYVMRQAILKAIARSTSPVAEALRSDVRKHLSCRNHVDYPENAAESPSDRIQGMDAAAHDLERRTLTGQLPQEYGHQMQVRGLHTGNTSNQY